MTLPLDYDCPKCGRKVGFSCVSRKAAKQAILRGAETHVARWKLAGIRRPTYEDRCRNYEDHAKRNAEPLRISDADRTPRPWSQRPRRMPYTKKELSLIERLRAEGFSYAAIAARLPNPRQPHAICTKLVFMRRQQSANQHS